MQYVPQEIEKKWQQFWADQKTFKAEDGGERPKYYVLDMFPYPSGAGLHVGHPLGYIASDIVSRYKRLKGFNVLHPMGYDSFGLPAEQYAIQTGQHPARTTAINIDGCLDDEGRIRPEFLDSDGNIKKEALSGDGKLIKGYGRQMKELGLSFDWDREVRTSDPAYYKWTQWIFLQLYASWYDRSADRARPIADLTSIFEKEGNTSVKAHCDETPAFSAADWNAWSVEQQQTVLLNYRIAYLSEAFVNWCPALGTVLANDEVKDGFSERGGHPVERKLMKQWSMRITAYAQRLLDGLDGLEWSESLKEQQRNWIGRSEGASISFKVLARKDLTPGPSPEERGDSPGYVTADPKVYSILMQRVKEMRADSTPAEERLWQVLRNDSTGHHFRRQHIIDRYIPDFVCLSKKLIVEVDGKIHDYTQDTDEVRTSRLNELGYVVLRFTNEEVLSDVRPIRTTIIDTLRSRPDFREADTSINEESSESVTPLPGRGAGGEVIEVFTTRPDTIFGVSFMVLAPEHDLVSEITTAEQKAEVETYIAKAKARSERDRMADVKTVSGAFTGAYVEHPFTGAAIPVWIGDYVLAGYGTGAIMAVPSGDERDYRFARHFNLPIPNVIEGTDVSEAANESKDGILCNSDFLNGLKVKDAISLVIKRLEEKGIGKGKVNYRQRDAVFGRQRYWGEPIPIYYKDGIPWPVKVEHLPVTLPEIDEYLPTETGEPPLGRAKGWGYDPEKGAVLNSPPGKEGSGEVSLFPFELSTMPGWAGSSWYFLRYMDPHNEGTFASKAAIDYWQNVDLYVGGSEHATGHLLYVRFWTKFLHDLGYLPFDEPAKKLVNQGMIQGVSQKMFILGYGSDENSIHVESDSIYYPIDGEFTGTVSFRGEVRQVAVSGSMQAKYPEQDFRLINVPIEFVNDKNELDINRFTGSRPDLFKLILITEDGYWKDGSFLVSEGSRFTVKPEVEKMSKSKWNVVNPDDIIAKYGADTLRLYEMFLGPLEDAKPWNTNGIEGTFRFLRKFWNLFFNNGSLSLTDEAPTKPELKALHATLKKVEDDMGKLSFNTCVSQFMICVNELGDLKCNKRAILEPLTVALSSFAPHICEELWQMLGHRESITFARFPVFDAAHLAEDTFSYPISFNGKTRLQLELSTALSAPEVEAAVMAHPDVIARLEGAKPKKVIVVPKRIVNVVV